MKKLIPLGIILVLLGVAQAADAQRAKAAKESQAMRQRIDALLKVRRSPAPMPLDPPNPFVQTTPPAGSANATTAGGALAGGNPNPALERAAPLRDDANATSTELLARFASRLKITGLIRLKDQVHVIINDSPWREGDFIIVDRSARLIQLQVVRIQPGSLTLRLDDAELVLRF